MIDRLLFVSQRQAVAMNPPAAAVLISITDSAAVAKAIAEAADVNFPADYEEYNHFVFEALRGPLKSAFQHA